MATPCPNCGAALDDAPELAGQLVTCPRCGGFFTTPEVVAPPIQRPASALPMGSIPVQRPLSFSAVARQRFQPSTSWWDIFDFKFEKYLTPWIVRGTWMLVCVGAILCVVLLVGGTFESILESSFPMRSTQSPASAPPVREEWRLRVPEKLSSPLARIFGCLLAIVAVVIWLLWVRVFLESVIVLFNIALNVASIDRKTKDPPHP